MTAGPRFFPYHRDQEQGWQQQQRNHQQQEQQLQSSISLTLPGLQNQTGLAVFSGNSRNDAKPDAESTFSVSEGTVHSNNSGSRVQPVRDTIAFCDSDVKDTDEFTLSSSSLELVQNDEASPGAKENIDGPTIRKNALSGFDLHNQDSARERLYLVRNSQEKQVCAMPRNQFLVGADAGINKERAKFTTHSANKASNINLSTDPFQKNPFLAEEKGVTVSLYNKTTEVPSVCGSSQDAGTLNEDLRSEQQGISDEDKILEITSTKNNVSAQGRCKHDSQSSSPENKINKVTWEI